jgi:hypothetical protein
VLISSHISHRNFVLLAPEAAQNVSFSFKNRYLNRFAVDSKKHAALLASAQKLRGRAYVEMGALHESQLTSDGRQVSEVDDRSWHLLTLDGRGQVMACMRYLAHPINVSFHELTIAGSALAKSEKWGCHLRDAVAGEIDRAKHLGYSFVELGGWAIAEALRCTSEALRMVVSAYALAQLSGGALGITTASLKSCSASILRRIGGREMALDGLELPSYCDAQYKSTEVEVLRFDSSSLNTRYQRWLEDSMAHLKDVPVIRRATDEHVFARTEVWSPSLCPVSC